MEPQKVLIVPAAAPGIAGFPELPNADEEILFISQQHIATVLPEPVTWESLLNAVVGDQEYDIIHFLGHLSNKGFAVGGKDQFFNYKAIRLAVNSGSFRLAFINTCDSEEVASQLAISNKAHVLCTIHEDIYDTDAANFSMAFYGKLRQEHIASYRQAFDEVVGSGGRGSTGTLFRYIVGKLPAVKRGDSVLREEIRTWREEIREEIRQLREKDRELESVLTGKYGEDGLTQRVKRTELQINELEDRTNSGHAMPPPYSYVVMGAILIIGFAVVYMAILAGGR